MQNLAEGDNQPPSFRSNVTQVQGLKDLPKATAGFRKNEVTINDNFVLYASRQRPDNAKLEQPAKANF